MFVALAFFLSLFLIGDYKMSRLSSALSGSS